MSNHRQVWLDWLNRNGQGHPLSLADAAPRQVASHAHGTRRVVVDAIADDGYSGWLVATYDGDRLCSLVLDDDECGLTVLAGA